LSKIYDREQQMTKSKMQYDTLATTSGRQIPFIVAAALILDCVVVNNWDVPVECKDLDQKDRLNLIMAMLLPGFLGRRN
jgi:hypothetical protein